MGHVNNRVEIKYDITGSTFDRVHQIDFIVIDNMGNIVYPDSVSGDIGRKVPARKNNKIIWDIYKEFDVVYGDFQPQIILDGSAKYGIKGGPENAIFSLLVPGLGDYFVADHKNMRIKPYYKTAFTYGLLGLSLAAKLNREQIPPVMSPPGWYYGADGLIYKDDWWVSKIERTDYWLFAHDAEIFLGIGIAAWLTDLIWVARQGVKNNKIRSALFDNLSLVPVERGFVLSFAYNF